MSIKMFLCSPRGTGKTRTLASLQTVGSTYVPLKFSGSPVPKGLPGPFLIDEISKQPKEMQEFVLSNHTTKDFYLTCGSEYTGNLLPVLRSLLSDTHPEAFI